MLSELSHQQFSQISTVIYGENAATKSSPQWFGEGRQLGGRIKIGNINDGFVKQHIERWNLIRQIKKQHFKLLLIVILKQSI